MTVARERVRIKAIARDGRASCVFTGKDVGKVRGTMIYSHKTAPTLQIMNKEVFDSTRRYYVPNGARSAVKNFSKNLCS